MGRPRRAQTEVAILDATIDELVERGYPGLTMEGVAARAGVAKTTIYRRWPGKDELLLAALSQAKGPIADPPSGPVRESLIYLINWMRRSWLDTRHGQVMRRLASDGSEHPELYSAFRQRLVAPRQQLIRDVLARGLDEGLIRAGTDLDDVLWWLTAPAIAAAMTHRQLPSIAQVEFMVDTVLAGLAP